MGFLSSGGSLYVINELWKVINDNEAKDKTPEEILEIVKAELRSLKDEAEWV